MKFYQSFQVHHSRCLRQIPTRKKANKTVSYHICKRIHVKCVENRRKYVKDKMFTEDIRKGEMYPVIMTLVVVNENTIETCNCQTHRIQFERNKGRKIY